MASYDTVPKSAKTQPTRYNVSIPEEKLQQMKQLISLSPIGPETYENLQESRDLNDFGISRKWLENAKAAWEKYDWRATESHINSFPHFTLPVKDDDGRTYNIHFVALFSTNPAAIPIAFFHGWPGSFLEFLPMLELLKKKYPSPDKLPYHIIVPSLPGFAFSDRPPKDKDWSGSDSGRLMHKLLEALGFGETGYVVQGGDIGSYVSRHMASHYDACKAVLLNFCPVPKPDNVSDSDITDEERNALARGDAFRTAGIAYAMKHATRPSTIGLVLSTSPLALLAWIGEKFHTWTDRFPAPLSTTLDSVTLYWLTATFPTSIYTYRHGLGPRAAKTNFHAQPENRIPAGTAFGYSWFPGEIMPTPRAWAAATGEELVWHRRHERGGHFAAMEEPAAMLGDVEDFVGEVWK
ncbi:epoxide hydrolase [Diplodia corticola]|uniref:Epoxide hydrolase n=1 Tax=Diplodia corticola TaxID=236234 RepID=A0A1J9R547_9PEZI|nr:epoxide hydrolase [Diplodia corticola]OJD36614.1 epoxide hydrolase [Diplodia corticola]